MIALLGGAGYIGTAYQRHLAAQGIACRSLSRSEVDYTRRDNLARFLATDRPEFLINCAGYTGKPTVDDCELHKTECLAANAVLPGIVRDACAATGTPWAHISSGCIYTGGRADGTGFHEDDPPNFTFRQNNCSFYSGAKALGEEILAGAAKRAPRCQPSTVNPSTPLRAGCQLSTVNCQLDCYIWRLRIPFTNIDHPRNYLTKLMRYDRLLDARNSLTQLDEFVRASLECWQRRLPFGTWNMTNPGSVTTREVVELIKQSGLVKKEFRFFASEEEFLELAAKTPRSNCVLDTTKIEEAGIRMTEVHEAIATALRQWRWK